MKGKIPKISKYRFMAFIAGALLFILALPHLSMAQSNIEVQILPREITSQPFDFSITVKVKPDINSLYSFSLLLNGQDITFALIVPTLKSPESGIAKFPDASTLKFVVPGISLPNGTHKIEVKVASSSGETASDSVTYSIGVTEPPPAATSFTKDIKPIFDNRCALSGCHAGSSPAMNMTLADPFDTTLGAVGVESIESSLLRINPGNPDQSYLVHKIQGTQTQVGGSGSRMPLAGCCLSDAEIQKIRKWIEEGAQNN